MQIRKLFRGVVLGVSLLNAESTYRITDYNLNHGNSDGFALDTAVSAFTPMVMWKASLNDDGLKDDPGRKEGFPVTSAEFIPSNVFSFKRDVAGTGDGKPTNTDFAIAATGAATHTYLGIPGSVVGALAAHAVHAMEEEQPTPAPAAAPAAKP